MKQTSVNRNKTAKVLALALGLGSLTLLSGITGCAGDRYTQSTGEHIDDKADSSRVKKALSADTQYKYDGVNVETFKGVVQLSGFVNSKEEKSRAGDITKTVEGVKEVKNNLLVKAN
jgi:osmotically-inducible protein OsmY